VESRPVMWWEGLTEKQRSFCEEYAANGGNAVKAAAFAGYKKPHPQGSDNLRKPTVIAALEALRQSITNRKIATRERRQEFWTTVMDNEAQEMNSRLKASELLGRSQGDFIERIKLEDSVITLRWAGNLAGKHD
jgi:phage terminase small subunit